MFFLDAVGLRALVVVLLVLVLILAAFCAARAFAAAEPPGGRPRGRLGGAALARGRGREATPKGGPTRGDLVNGAPPPSDALLASGLGGRFEPGGAFAFDIRAGVPEQTPWLEGLYCGQRAYRDLARATMLTPAVLNRAAISTSGGVYAWFVLDSPEGCFALKASPKDGKVLDLDETELIEWLRNRLHGSPPHKIKLADWLAHLRGQGLTIRHGPLRESEARFDLRDVTTPAERQRRVSALRALPFTELEGFDWSEYDAAAGRQACSVSREMAGDVTVDLAARKVGAPKVRYGLLSASWPHVRSYVTFHTHPAMRYQGQTFEPPSKNDLGSILWECAESGLAFHLVSAPEGTYMLRPSETLIEAYRRDPVVRDEALGAYKEHLRCVGGVLACAEHAVRAMREAGFIAHFRPAPCRELSDRPQMLPYFNRLNREEHKAAFAEASGLAGPELLAADWTPAATLGSAHSGAAGALAATWLIADHHHKAIRPLGPGHRFRDPSAPSSYDLWEAHGPLTILFFPSEGDFPPRVPHAAIEAAREHADSWAWVVLLSPTRVTVFRAGPRDVEIHGPAAWGPKRARAGPPGPK